jgi:hypothetical protein
MSWLLHSAFVWFIRLAVLVAACLTVQHLINEELGYRMEFQPMLIIALLMIVVVRIWMPWSMKDRPERDRME